MLSFTIFYIGYFHFKVAPVVVVETKTMNAHMKKTLSPEEKEKIKERLTLLKQEYNTAVKKLQRAQRAQKVKNHIKETIAEQNRKIEEELVLIKSGTSNESSPDTKNIALCDGLDASFPHAHQDKKMTVTFNLEPEVINLNSSPQDILSSDVMHEDPGNISLVLVEQRCGTEVQMYVKNRMKLKSSRRKLKEKESKPLLNNSPVFDSICSKISGKETDCNNRCRGSPFFEKSDNKNAQDCAKLTAVSFGDNTIGISSVGSLEDAFLEDNGCKTVVQAAAEPELGCFFRSPLFEIKPTPNVLNINNHYSSDTDMCKNEAVECCHQQTEDKLVLNKTRGSKCVAKHSRSAFPASAPLVSFGDPTDKMVSSRDDLIKHHDENLSGGAEVASSSCPDTQGDTSKHQHLADMTNQPEVGSNTLEKSSTALVENPLSSCTLVEGLLFPVEYYIRTTRRMSACQRQVDLEAVICSQLGKSKKTGKRKTRSSLSAESKADLDTSRREESNFSQTLPIMVNEQFNSADPILPDSSVPCLQINENQHVVCITASNMPNMKIEEGKETKTGRRRCSAKARRLSKASTSHLQNSVNQIDNKGKKDGVDVHCYPSDSQSEKENCLEEENAQSALGRKRSSSSPLDNALQVSNAESDYGTSTCTVSAHKNGTQALRGQCLIPEHIQNSINGATDKTLRTSRDVLESWALDSEVDATQTVCQTPVNLVTSPVLQSQQSDSRGMPLFCFSEVDAVVSPMNLHPKKTPKGLKNSALKKACFQTTKNVHSESDTENFCSEPIFDEHKFRFGIENASYLNTIDFDLPDDVFGQLKLEKIKSHSLRHFKSVSSSSQCKQTVNETNSRPHTRTELFTQNSPSKQVNKCSQKSESDSVNTNLSNTVEKHLSETDLSHCKEVSSGVLSTPTSTFPVGRNSLHDSLNTSPVFPSLGFTPNHGISISQQSFVVLSDSIHECPSQSKSSSPQIQKGSSTTKINTCSTHGINCSDHKPTWVEGEEEKCLSVIKDEWLVRESFTGCRVSGGKNLSVSGYEKEPSQEDVSSHLKKCVSSPTSTATLTSENTGLQLISEFKVDSSSFVLDLNTVWWKVDGTEQLCIVTASISTVSLWKPQVMDQWLEIHTWHFTEVPIVQIVSMPDTTGLISVALGQLKIEEIRALVYTSEDVSLEQLLIVSGDISAVLGLSEARLVICRGTRDIHEVELIFISTKGRNTETGQLLQTINIGKSCPSSICRGACSDSGMLFILVSLHCMDDDASSGHSVFRLFAANPKTACSIPVMSYTLPAGNIGRYVAGDVKSSCAVALLTSGAIAIWNLSIEDCTVWLPPSYEKDWSLVKWANTKLHLLAGQKDGKMFLYKYLESSRKEI
ncbi:partner and localizer of BRCA2 isoform X2 [Protopterus annectens]|uniref:partner and localizer of BRCA2 isoform X2 n=1 Tax=Protopterus annectens TaxID=7888 RepID=UPI001CF9BC2B|nr:partner and localizer of BRCA2 isoform X2 [Protopterus annectens]